MQNNILQVYMHKTTIYSVKMACSDVLAVVKEHSNRHRD